MKCPFRLLVNGGYLGADLRTECQEEGCAWYLRPYSKCAPVVLVERMEEAGGIGSRGAGTPT